jgi:hypothetical protein
VAGGVNVQGGRHHPALQLLQPGLAHGVLGPLRGRPGAQVLAETVQMIQETHDLCSDLIQGCPTTAAGVLTSAVTLLFSSFP